MGVNKTISNRKNVLDFLNKITEVEKKKDAFELLDLMHEITKQEPKMWGASIIGFGAYHYKYESGREGDMFLSGFSSRKQNLTIYIMSGLSPYKNILNKIGKHKVGKSCFYFKKLADIDKELLSKMIRDSVLKIQKKYP